MTSTTLNKSLLLLRQLGFIFSNITGSKLPKTILRRLFRYAQSDVLVTNFDGDLSISLNLSEHMQRRIFWMGYYNEEIANVLSQYLTLNMVVLDIGANIGEITLLAAKRVGKHGRVYAFEPMDNIANKLTQHIELNHFTQVEVYRCALGNKPNSQIAIYSSCGQQSNDKNEGLGSLYSKNNQEKPIQYVELTTMDIWVSQQPNIHKIDLIKIDIEGAELACLQGAKQTLKKFKPKIIIEIQDFSAERAGYKAIDIIDLLSDLSYEFFRIEKAGKLIPITRADLLDFQNVLCIHHEDPNQIP